MSEVDTTTQPSSLEEAIKELDSLRAQLSGSDLEVFSQNRELRRENQKLKDEIRQLTEQCVSQTFTVRGLEKSEEKLKAEGQEKDTKIQSLEAQTTELSSKASGLETKVSDLESKVSGLESKVTDLGGEVEKHRSQELQLSEELKKTLADNSENLEKLKLEHSQEVESKVAELAKAKQEFEDTVSAKEDAIKALENRVEKFKEEFLSQEIDPVVASAAPSAAAGGAFELLTEKMEGFLGFPGRALVEQVFRLSGVEQSSTDPTELEETFEALQDTASQLVRSEEQEKELATILQSAWEQIGLGSAPPKKSAEPVADAPAPEPEPAKEETPEAAAPVAEEEKAEEEPAAPEVAEVAEEAAEPEVAEEPEPEPEPEPAAEDPAEAEEAAPPETEASVEAEAEAAPEPEVEAEESPEESPEEAQAEESQPEATVEETTTEDAPAVEAAAEPESGEAPSFEQAAALLEDGQHSKALPLFESLCAQDDSESTYQVGRIACLAGIGRFQEAYDHSRPLLQADLGDSREIFDESVDTALMGLASEADSDLVRKEYILELVERTKANDQVLTYLDEADEIGMRIAREGELSLLQATHRISQDDVTEYLIDALHSLADRPEVFGLMRTNLERYPELTPLSDFMDRLLDSSRADSLEAESSVKELLGQGGNIEDLLDETDPGEEAVVQVFLEHLIPRSKMEFDIPSEDFEELMLEAEPAAFIGSLRQALRSVDYTLFFDEIEVLSYDGEDHFLLRSSPEPKPTLLFGAELDDVPPEELRFLVLRELFSMYRRHSQLAHISAGLDDARRVKLVQACVDIFSEFESQVSDEIKTSLDKLSQSATSGGQDADFKVQLESFLREVYIQTESDSFVELGDFLYDGQLNRKWLDSIADAFGAKQTGIVVASFAICRDALGEDEFEQLEENGFNWLYSDENKDKYGELRLRLQRLWTSPLKALISDPEE